MKHIWILQYYNQKGLIVKTAYFTSKMKALNFLRDNEMPPTSTTWQVFPAEIY